MSNLIFNLQWHITDKCDQRCKHCYIFEGENKECSKELELQVLETILENFLDFCKKVDRVPGLTITGGDPILYKNFWEFVELLHKKEIRFSVLGNPFHLSGDVVAKLEACGCRAYQMSLDGLKNTHDFIRKPGSFEATLKALKLFENSKILTAIMTTVSKTNIDEIAELVDVVVQNKVDYFGFARYCPNPDDSELMVSPLEYRDLLEKVWQKYEQYCNEKTIFVLKDHLWQLFLYEKGLFNPRATYNPNDLIIDGCHCGINHLTVLPDGVVYACRRSETPIGKVPEQSFYEIFTGEKISQYTCFDKFEHCLNCELKNFCRGCPSVAKCFTGNFYAKDPQCWKTFD